MNKKEIQHIVNEINKRVEELKPFISQIKGKTNRTQEEENQLQEVRATLNDLKQEIHNVQQLLSDELLRYSLTSYYQLKEAADQGNEEAARAADYIRPTFYAAMRKWAEQSIN